MRVFAKPHVSIHMIKSRYSCGECSLFVSVEVVKRVSERERYLQAKEAKHKRKRKGAHNTQTKEEENRECPASATICDYVFL